MSGAVCQYCGSYHGVRCPIVKAIEYHPNMGGIKRVEFYDPPPTYSYTWAFRSGNVQPFVVSVPSCWPPTETNYWETLRPDDQSS